MKVDCSKCRYHIPQSYFDFLTLRKPVCKINKIASNYPIKCNSFEFKKIYKISNKIKEILYNIMKGK